MGRKITTLITLVVVVLFSQVTYAGFYYEIGEQKEILSIQQNGMTYLTKEFTFHVESRSTELGTEVWVGLPTSDTSVISASFSLNGETVTPNYKINNDDEIQVIFTNFPAIHPGETGRFSFKAQIPDLIYWLSKKELEKAPEDQLVSISYIPAWWDQARVGLLSLEMEFEKPLDINKIHFFREPIKIDHTKTGTRLIWQSSNLSPNQKIKHAVTLPRQYFSPSMTPEKDWMPTWVLISLLSFGLLGTTLLIWGITYSVKNRRYNSPVAYMSGNKAYTSFDPVETALFYNLSTDLIVKLIIMGLVNKNVIQIHDNNTMKRVSTLESLKWYEEHFLNSIDENIQIIPQQWKEEYKEILGTFYEKVEGYCGRQTLSHYNNYLKNHTFTEHDDPRWIILQKQLANGLFDDPKDDELKEAMPAYIYSYMPLFYLTIISPSLEKESHAQYNNVFPGAQGGNGGNSGSGCACACACACASSGGCT